MNNSDESTEGTLNKINREYAVTTQARMAAVISFASVFIGLVMWTTYPNPSVINQGWQYYDVYATIYELIPALLAGMFLIGVIAAIDSRRLGGADE